MGKGAVVAVALGAGPKYRSPYSENIDYVVQNIPTLISMLAEHQYKLLMGRQQGRDHATFPKPDLRPGREVTADQIQRYQLYKSTFARAVELGVFDITVDDFREIQDTSSHHSDEDDDFEWTY